MCKDCLISVDWTSGDERIDKQTSWHHDFVEWALFLTTKRYKEFAKGGFGAIYKSQKDLNANDRLISQDVPYIIKHVFWDITTTRIR